MNRNYVTNHSLFRHKMYFDITFHVDENKYTCIIQFLKGMNKCVLLNVGNPVRLYIAKCSFDVELYLSDIYLVHV